jgi:hypothetical protein
VKKEIAQAVKANRRMLGLVDDQLACLAKTTPSVALDAIDADRRMPYWYVATSPTPQAASTGLSAYTKQNANQSPFIRITQGYTVTPSQTSVQYPNIGYIRVQSDAAFVATSIFANFYQSRGSQFDLIPRHGTLYAALGNKVGVRLYDESSNRWLTLTNQNQTIQQNATLPGQAISPSALLFENSVRLPTECTFPRNALIRVEIYYYQTLTVFSGDIDIYFAIGGYKVFGG